MASNGTGSTRCQAALTHIGRNSKLSWKKRLREEDFLLAALSHICPNPVDNLTTKANLTYSEVRLYIGAGLQQSKTCSYCKKQGGTSVGHIWQDCRKLKRDQKRKQDKTAWNNQQQQPAGNNQQSASTNQQQPSNQGLIAAAFFLPIYPKTWT